ncbi:MAG TPA: hypothetical protein VJ719_06295 [Chthoniobacterales bacterium]|nr:hypothetical protein [Chthoniobacterales bacterium]
MKTYRLFGSTIVLTLAFAVSVIDAQAEDPSTTPTAESSSKAEAAPPAAAGSGSSATATSSEKADTEVDGVTAEVVSVTRTDGDTVTIKFKYTNSGQKTAELNLTGYSPDNLAAKVYYIDGKNKKKYLPVTDAAGTPVCSNTKGSTKLDAGESKSGWTKLPAPPAGVSTISVYLPGTPPFEGLTIAAK